MTYKDSVINAIQWFYGCSKKKAAYIYKTSSDESRQNYLRGFENNAQKSFYTD